MCRKHKRKTGNKPSADCQACWLEYFAECPDAPITAKDLWRFLFLAHGLNTQKFKVDMMWKAMDNADVARVLEGDKRKREKR